MNACKASLVRDVVFDLPFSNFDGDVSFGLAPDFLDLLLYFFLFFLNLFCSFLNCAKLLGGLVREQLRIGNAKPAGYFRFGVKPLFDDVG